METVHTTQPWEGGDSTPYTTMGRWGQYTLLNHGRVGTVHPTQPWEGGDSTHYTTMGGWGSTNVVRCGFVRKVAPLLVYKNRIEPAQDKGQTYIINYKWDTNTI